MFFEIITQWIIHKHFIEEDKMTLYQLEPMSTESMSTSLALGLFTGHGLSDDVVPDNGPESCSACNSVASGLLKKFIEQDEDYLITTGAGVN